MTTLKILTFCFAWRYSDLDGISAELEYLAFSGQSALEKIRFDLHCCGEMAGAELLGHMIDFANDTNWAGFRHLRVLEVKIDMFLGMKDATESYFIIDLQMEIRDNFTGLSNRIGLQVVVNLSIRTRF